MCRSYVDFLYEGCIYGSVRVCSLVIPFFSKCKMSIVSSIVPYVCCMSQMCCEYLEFGLLDRIASICRLFLVLKFLPVCLTYVNWYLLHFICYIPLLLNLSVICFLGWRSFCTVFQFYVLYVFLNTIVIIIVSFPTYVNSVHNNNCFFRYMKFTTHKKTEGKKKRNNKEEFITHWNGINYN
jgi:hypothetical protein